MSLADIADAGRQSPFICSRGQRRGLAFRLRVDRVVIQSCSEEHAREVVRLSQLQVVSHGSDRRGRDDHLQSRFLRKVVSVLNHLAQLVVSVNVDWDQAG